MKYADRKAFDAWYRDQYGDDDAATDAHAWSYGQAWQAACEWRDSQAPTAQINQALLTEALQAVETVLADAYHRHFAECCGRGQGGCCGDFIEQWTPEDHKILDTLSPIQRKLQAALQAARG